MAQPLRGGEFLLVSQDPQSAFTPEDWTEEQRLIFQSAREFVEKEVWSHLDQLDSPDHDLMLQLLKKSAELGLTGFSIPEEYGGAGGSFDSATILAEALGPAHSFAVTFFAHTGIGTLPIQYFGTENQRKKYLPRLATAEIVSAYCLTEPNAGSDALSIRTTARLNDAGTHYLLNGQKIFITNAGFADLFIVFAKIDGEHFTAFIVEKDFGGISLGNEEKKMGIKGSSTRPVFFEDTPVPRENVLGEIGKGHYIAFGILNVGRFKLGAACLGSAKVSFERALQYSQERIQFGKPIAEFGAIQWKLSEMALQIFALESLVYRVSHMIHLREEAEKQAGKTAEASMTAAREYAIETAICKVAGSEILDYVVDETLQVYGGYGFIEEYPPARMYRDSRINRIFEGTNEINRLLILSMLLRKSMKGELDVMKAITEAQKALTDIGSFTGISLSSSSSEHEPDPLAEEHARIQDARRLIHLLAGALFMKFGEKLEDQQELLMHLADMILGVSLAESACLRAQKYGSQFPIMVKLAQLAVRKYLHQVQEHAREVVDNATEGDEHRMLQGAIRRWTRLSPLPTISLRREIARHFLARKRYTLS